MEFAGRWTGLLQGLKDRKLFRNRLPLWFIIFSIVIMLAVGLLFAWLPAVAESRQAYGRGLEAEKEKKYVSAIREYKKAEKLFPFTTGVYVRLGVSYYYNGQIKEAGEVFDSIVEKRAGRKLTAEANAVVKKINSMYYMSEELGKILSGYGKEELEKTRDKLLQYSSRYPDDVLGLFYTGNIYFDLEKYSLAAEYFNKVITSQPEFFSAYLNLAATYRELGKYQEAEESCQRVLEYNIESVPAYVALSKTEQKQGNYTKFLEYAQKAYSIDSTDESAAANLSAAYHFNGMTGERDKLFSLLKSKNYYGLEALKRIYKEKP